ncbi:DNA-directed RNA polymerase subunit beta' [Labeo rohita]|uniref:DNA-directed RNA polymerase subunit beta n=1 Tax=Labeo rohita TaxID=84645 RepID=A0ABQ8MXA3_LABRO|nr:DNA-directed RNA polymerase subunit beta' [Labeo rohita]
MSVQVCELATTLATREKTMASDVAVGSSVHCNMAEGELVEDLGLFEAEGVAQPSGGSQMTTLHRRDVWWIPCLRLQPQSPGLQLARQPSGSTMAPSSQLSAVARQSTGSTRLPHPLGCPHPSYTSGLHSSSFTSSLHPSGSVRLLHPSSSWIHAYVSVSGAISSSALRLSVPRNPPPPAPPPSVGPQESSVLPPPWLLPLLAPPWVDIMAVAWVPPGSSCSKFVLSPTGLSCHLPASFLCRLYPGLCLSSSS